MADDLDTELLRDIRACLRSIRVVLLLLLVVGIATCAAVAAP